MKYFLRKLLKGALSILMLIGIIIVILVVVLIVDDNSTKVSDAYTINYYEDGITISDKYSSFGQKYIVPKKTYTKLGLEYFCTIEMVDSNFIVHITNKYDNFGYEVMRFYVYNMIESTIDNDSITIDKLRLSYLNTKSEYPDTLYCEGLKIYDIEKYDFDKFIEYTQEDVLYYENRLNKIEE